MIFLCVYYEMNMFCTYTQGWHSPVVVKHCTATGKDEQFHTYYSIGFTDLLSFYSCLMRGHCMFIVCSSKQIWGVLVLLKFCWRAHMGSFFSQKVLVPSFHAQNLTFNLMKWNWSSNIKCSFLAHGRAVCARTSEKCENFSKTSTPQSVQ